MTMKACGTCKWLLLDYLYDTPEESLGFCEWPADRLPYSLRYGNRERMMVSPVDGRNCNAYEAKEND
jgi:hypothetical protein